MLAVAALIRDLGIDRPLLVATTRYVAEDPTACFAETAKDLAVSTYAAPISFADSPYPGLSDYEKGFVKEGVGAGGSVWYAGSLGVSCERVVRRVEILYAEMTGQTR
jgi:NaMN:DMB phosphoribosyltransferase